MYAFSLTSGSLIIHCRLTASCDCSHPQPAISIARLWPSEHA